MAYLVKSPPANAGDARDTGSIPGSERSYGEGNGSSLQYSCLGNSTDRGVWRAAVHGVAKSRAWLSTQASILYMVSTYTLVNPDSLFFFSDSLKPSFLSLNFVQPTHYHGLCPRVKGLGWWILSLIQIPKIQSLKTQPNFMLLSFSPSGLPHSSSHLFICKNISSIFSYIGLLASFLLQALKCQKFRIPYSFSQNYLVQCQTQGPISSISPRPQPFL